MAAILNLIALNCLGYRGWLGKWAAHRLVDDWFRFSLDHEDVEPW